MAQHWKDSFWEGVEPEPRESLRTDRLDVDQRGRIVFARDCVVYRWDGSGTERPLVDLNDSRPPERKAEGSDQPRPCFSASASSRRAFRHAGGSLSHTCVRAHEARLAA